MPWTHNLKTVRRLGIRRGGQPPKKDGWTQRVLSEPRFGLVVLIGAVAGTPGALYIS